MIPILAGLAENSGKSLQLVASFLRNTASQEVSLVLRNKKKDPCVFLGLSLLTLLSEKAAVAAFAKDLSCPVSIVSLKILPKTRRGFPVQWIA